MNSLNKIIFEDVLYSIKNMMGPFLVINNYKNYLFIPHKNNKCTLFPKRFIKII